MYLLLINVFIRSYNKNNWSKNTVIKKEVNMEEITKKLIVLLGEFDDYYHNKFLPLYGPGGIYHVPRKHKGLRLDNVEDLEEKGQNVN